MPKSLDILFAGAGEYGLPTLKALREAGHRIVQVVSQPDRPAGRGRKLTPTPIAQYALDQNIDAIRTENFNALSLPPVDLMVVIAFGQKISEAHANHPRLGSVNLHASRLPRYRGAAPIHFAILGGETVTGNSVIRLAQRMDAGAVLGLTEVSIGGLETTGELHDRLATDGAGLMLRVVDQLASGTATETPQDESQATRASKLTRQSTLLDWSRPAAEIARRIRAMYPWPGCRIRVLDQTGAELNRVTLVRARAANDDPAAPGMPLGCIIADRTIKTSRGSVEIIELQPESKRPMTLEAYMNGHRWETGLRLESIA